MVHPNSIDIPIQSSKESWSDRRKIRLGIVGCGYVTAMSHLPASSFVNEIEVVALVDVQEELAQKLAQTYQVPIVTCEYREIYNEVDAAIIAVPHQMHTPIALDFLSRGIHLLVEKPLAITTSECEQILATAERAQARLAVGHMRRFYDNNRIVKRIIETRFLGAVQRFEAEEAVLFDRFKASAFTILPPAGGVLLDTGPHLLDLLLWWFGDFDELSYWDDAVQGVEANCRIELKTASGIPGTVFLSRTRHLENVIRIYCVDGMIEVNTLNPIQVTLHSPVYSGPISTAKNGTENSRNLTPYFARQLVNFANAIIGNEDLYVPGKEGMRSIAAIERCKRVKQPLEMMSWMQLNEQILGRVNS